MPTPDLTIKPDEIEWRVGNTFERNNTKWGMLLGYIDSRLAMEKLDLLDPQWSSRMEPVQLNGDSGIRCTLTVNGVSREDVGTASNTEPLKGAFSDALKRAAVHFGIGRELYDLPAIGVECNVGANGKVKSPKALPVWNGTRWTIDQRVGFVRYDHEPAPPAPQQDGRAERQETSAPQSSQPEPRTRGEAQQAIVDAMRAHGWSLRQVDDLAAGMGISRGEATIQQLLALRQAIETPGSGVPTASPATETRDERPSSDGATTPARQPEAGDSPPVPAPAADSPSDPRLTKYVQDRITLAADGCWQWTGSLTNEGYGRLRQGDTETAAHRWVYEALRGAIPDGLEPDHLCRNRACVNPAHIEPVTHRENTLRSDAASAINARKTHCDKGHPLDGDNLVVTTSNGRQFRRCRTCHRASHSAPRSDAPAADLTVEDVLAVTGGELLPEKPDYVKKAEARAARQKAAA